jgi:hypothetical protein
LENNIMARFLISVVGSLRPFASASLLSLLMLPAGGSLSAKPKSQCALLGTKEACVALVKSHINLCQWVDMSGSFTVNGVRKSYCRGSSKTITREQFEALQAVRDGSSAQAKTAQ